MDTVRLGAPEPPHLLLLSPIPCVVINTATISFVVLFRHDRTLCTREMRVGVETGRKICGQECLYTTVSEPHSSVVKQLPRRSHGTESSRGSVQCGCPPISFRDLCAGDFTFSSVSVWFLKQCVCRNSPSQHHNNCWSRI